MQRRTVEQIVDCVPEVPLLDAPVPQTVVQLVEVLRPLDTVVPEQVIEAPAIPQRAVLPEPQMAEQLVDEPVPSFDDFELVEAGEEEEEEKLPRMVPGTRAWDAEGHEWSRVVGPLVAYRHLHRPVDPPRRGPPPGQGGIEILAPRRWLTLRLWTSLCSCSTVSSSLWCFLSSSTEWWLFQLLYRDRSAQRCCAEDR